jgi:hypothetical protein
MLDKNENVKNDKHNQYNGQIYYGQILTSEKLSERFS